MKNNKKLGLIVWILGLSFSLILIFLVSKDLTGATYAAAVCTVVVYLLHLSLWVVLQKEKGKLFYNLPSLTLSVFSLVVQTTWAIIVAFAETNISVKKVIGVNILLLIIQAIAIVLTLVSKNYIESVDKRQKNHHIEL